jgi:hypothetical protein
MMRHPFDKTGGAFSTGRAASGRPASSSAKLSTGHINGVNMLIEPPVFAIRLILKRYKTIE